MYFKLLMSAKPVVPKLNLHKNHFRILIKIAIHSDVLVQKVWGGSENPHPLTNNSGNSVSNFQRAFLEKH